MENKKTTAERLQEIMRERGLRQVDLLEKCAPIAKYYGVKINKVAIHNYVTGRVLPKQDKLLVLGKALNVNEAWLMGFEVSPERKPEPVPVDFVLSNGDQEILIEACKEPQDKDRLISYARKLAELREMEKK